MKQEEQVVQMMWTERMNPKPEHIIFQITQERARGWVEHEKPEAKRMVPAEPSQPPGARMLYKGQPTQPQQQEKSSSQIGVWAAKMKGGWGQCQAYQTNNCSGESCTMGVHICAMITRRGPPRPAGIPNG